MSGLPLRVARRALEQWYLTSGGTPPRAHACWQSPFAFGLGAASPKERGERVRRAGDIWLRNYDLSFAGQLWLSDLEQEQSWCFRRCREIGGRHLVIGPLDLVVVEPGVGRHLPPYPLRYLETDDPDLDALAAGFR